MSRGWVVISRGYWECLVGNALGLDSIMILKS